jgi:hypothetical protein
MQVKQIANDLNEIFKELIGTYDPEDNPDGIPLYKEDLSNFIDVGRKIEGTTEWGEHFDNYIGKLIDRIGKTIIVDKKYESTGPDLAVDAVEYGSIIQKIRVSDIEFEDNDAWKLQAGQSYDYFTFKPVEMSQTFFNGKTTFNLEWSWASKQLKESVTNLSTLMSIYAAIENRIKTKAKIATDGMKMRLVNAGNAENLAAGKNVINFMEEYINNTGDTSLRSATALSNKAFNQNLVITLQKYSKFIELPTKMFNLQNELNWTQDNKMMVGLVDLEANAEVYLESDTFHNEFVKLPGYYSVAAWQGITEGMTLDLRSSINVETPTSKEHIMYSGIVFTIFDKTGKVVWNEEPEQDVAPRNPKGKFVNYYYSYDCNYMLDTAEPCLTFVISDYAIVPTEPADWGTGTYYNLDPDTGEYTEVTEENFADAGVVYRNLFSE